MKIEEAQFQTLVTGFQSRYELWEQIIRTSHIAIMAEIGVWKGAFAKYVLEQCEFIQCYYMIDPWTNLPGWNKPFNVSTEAFRDVYSEAMRNTEFASEKRIVLKGTSKEMLDKIPDGSLDFAYIDGDHTLRGITIDLIRVFPKVKESGFIGGDDFKAPSRLHLDRFEPTLVCPFSAYFAEAMDLPIVALPFNQFIIQKRSGSAYSFTDTTGHITDLFLAKHAFPFIPIGVKRMVKRIFSRLGLR